MLPHPVFPQHYNSLIQISRRWKKYPRLYVIFMQGNQKLDIKEVTKDIADNYVSSFVIL